jgi:energy-coupling factor transporter ATP-binding protein EcfA2
MNAAVLGLTHREVEEKFESITKFADIGDFIDQPTKTYSSGMMVRLAFAVQCAIEPDILIIDEALSVGDVAFRNKCLERIQRMRENGVTTLFVSHDLGSLQLLCNRVIWLEKGKLIGDGDPCEVCQNFFAKSMGISNLHSEEDLASLVPQQGTGKAFFKRIELDAPSIETRQILKTLDSLRFTFKLEAMEKLADMAIAISIYRTDGDWVIGQTSREAGVFWPGINAGEFINGRITLPDLSLASGDYIAAFAAYDSELKICYALTDLILPFSVRSDYPTWGKIVHPCLWQN